jgi:hypothetical protein
VRRSFVVGALALVIVPAVAYGTLSMLRWLGLGLRAEDPETKMNYLIGAAQRAHRPEVERLVKLRIVPATAVDGDGYTALMGAARGGDPEIARLLLDGGAPVDARTSPEARSQPKGITALMIAAYAGHPAIVRLLLDRGADPNLRAAESDGVSGDTALTFAIEANSVPVVELLLARGARADLPRSVRGIAYAPLTIALDRRRFDIAERLAAAGASVDVVVPGGGWTGCTQLMLFASSRPEPAPEAIAWAARHSRDLDRYGGPGGPCDRASAIMRAEASGNWRTALELLRMGAHPFPPGVPRSDFTPVERARYEAALARRAAGG